jgi:hypothetical protein
VNYYKFKLACGVRKNRILNNKSIRIHKSIIARDYWRAKAHVMEWLGCESLIHSCPSFLLLYFPHTLADAQLYPFSQHSQKINDKYKLKIARCNILDFTKNLKGVYPKVKYVGFQTWFDIGKTESDELIECVKSRFPNAKIIFFDWFAPTDLRLGKVLGDGIDLYVKKNTLANMSKYKDGHNGDTTLMDFYGKRFGINYDHKNYNLSDDFLAKVITGPNFNTAPFLNSLFSQSSNELIDRFRPLDLHARIETKGTDWYSAMRQASIYEVQKLKNVNAVFKGMVGFKQYLKEMMDSKITFSPFGYGESCWRDYEAVALGSLLIKPDMSHMTTTPSIFIDGETYISVKWDLSDFNEKLHYYLNNDDERRRIAKNAFDVCHDYIGKKGFMSFFGNLIERTK